MHRADITPQMILGTYRVIGARQFVPEQKKPFSVVILAPSKRSGMNDYMMAQPGNIFISTLWEPRMPGSIGSIEVNGTRIDIVPGEAGIYSFIQTPPGARKPGSVPNNNTHSRQKFCRTTGGQP